MLSAEDRADAAGNPRVTAVVAAETFTDLRTVATGRAPFFFTSGTIDRAFRLAEERGQFLVASAGALEAASTVTAPVLLIHGEADIDTPPDHSRRVFDALRGPKRLIIVPGAPHNGSLRAEIWGEIEQWIDGVIGLAH